MCLFQLDFTWFGRTIFKTYLWAHIRQKKISTERWSTETKANPFWKRSSWEKKNWHLFRHIRVGSVLLELKKSMEFCSLARRLHWRTCKSDCWAARVHEMRSEQQLFSSTIFTWCKTKLSRSSIEITVQHCIFQSNVLHHARVSVNTTNMDWFNFGCPYISGSTQKASIPSLMHKEIRFHSQDEAV